MFRSIRIPQLKPAPLLRFAVFQVPVKRFYAIGAQQILEDTEALVPKSAPPGEFLAFLVEYKLFTRPNPSS